MEVCDTRIAGSQWGQGGSDSRDVDALDKGKKDTRGSVRKPLETTRPATAKLAQE